MNGAAVLGWQQWDGYREWSCNSGLIVSVLPEWVYPEQQWLIHPACGWINSWGLRLKWKMVCMFTALLYSSGVFFTHLYQWCRCMTSGVKPTSLDDRQPGPTRINSISVGDSAKQQSQEKKATDWILQCRRSSPGCLWLTARGSIKSFLIHLLQYSPVFISTAKKVVFPSAFVTLFVSSLAEKTRIVFPSLEQRSNLYH